MISEGLGEMFEGDFADTCAGKFPLVSMGGLAEGLACADPGARTPIGTSGNLFYISFPHPVLNVCCPQPEMQKAVLSDWPSQLSVRSGQCGWCGHTVQGSIVSAVCVVGRCGQAGSRESGHL